MARIASLADLKSLYYTSLGLRGSISDMEYEYYRTQLSLPLGNGGSLSAMKYEFYNSRVAGGNQKNGE